MPRPTQYGMMDDDVMEHPTLRPVDKLVFTALRRFENFSTGQCNPSRATIARKISMSKPSVTAALNRLIKARIIVVQQDEKYGKNYVLRGQPSDPLGSAE